MCMVLCTLLQDNHDLMLRQLKLQYYASHNEAGNIIVSRLKACRLKAKILYLFHDSTKHKLTNLQHIADALAHYYGSLYNLKDDPISPQPLTAAIS